MLLRSALRRRNLLRPVGSRGLAFSADYLKDESERFGRRWDPNDIIPAGHKQVRVCSNTTRDAQQSNLSAEMSDEHRQVVGSMINEVYQGMDGVPGYEQTWGGTVPMFDVWKRGVQPFDELKQMSRRLPDTPQSALIRSTGLNAMGTQPNDVVDEFIRLTYQAGVDVFTNFDAHNDWRNHVRVAEAVHKNGGHYQAAISWAVFHPDPTIYTAQWCVDFFEEIMPLEPHSLYVKDPSGVLTPEMAGVLAATLKDRFPDIPLAFHTHYQTGYAYMTYWEAVRNGANAVECSLGFPDGAGQPYSLTLLRAFEDLGYDTGNPNQEAMTRIADYCTGIRPAYTMANQVRTPDVRVEFTGIAGGQRTILNKELVDAGQAHLIPEVDREVQRVRVEGGKVCQVTPAADAYAREAIRRLRGGDPDSGFTPGYAAILVGEGGRTQEPVDEAKRATALTERAEAKLQELYDSGRIASASVVNALRVYGIPEMRKVMDQWAEPVLVTRRIHEVKSRLDQLARIVAADDGTPQSQKASLERKIARAAQAHDSLTPDVTTLADRVQVLQAELEGLQSRSAELKDVIDEDQYQAILFRAPSSEVLHRVDEQCPTVAELRSSGELSEPEFHEVLAWCGYVSCCFADMLPDGLPAARAEVDELESKHTLGLKEHPRVYEEAVLLQAKYRKAAIAGMITNFFKNYRLNRAFWDPTYNAEHPDHKGLHYASDDTGLDAVLGELKSAAARRKPQGLRMHSEVRRLVGRDAMDAVGELNERILALQAKVTAQERLAAAVNDSPSTTVEEQVIQEFDHRMQLEAGTVDALRAELSAAQAARDELVEKSVETVVDALERSNQYQIDDKQVPQLVQTVML